MPSIVLGDRLIGNDAPTYFIADISANHDGEIERARSLIHKCGEAGANAAKFQNFRAAEIVSDYGFRSLGGQLSHQAGWKKSVYQTYEDASLPWEWTEILKSECNTAGIDFLSSPYDFEAVDMLDPYVAAFKIGSGDITWLEMLEYIARKGKPVILATGASDINDVQRAIHTIEAINPQLAVLQCNTNYTGSLENLKHIHLNVLKTYRELFPNVVLGLSDHTPGYSTVLGSVALGARIVEKHFTDDTNREGPDHPFSMTSEAWKDMVDRTRELEHALGSADKVVADNEMDTVVVQRRCLRAARDIEAGTEIEREMVAVLRPANIEGIFPYEIDKIIGMKTRVDVPAGEYFKWSMLEG